MDEHESSCPRCKTTKYRNPSLKLMVNVCGHALCENCVNLLFAKGSGNCPSCNTGLRRQNFQLQIFDDPMVEKELRVRRKILKDFCKKETDFATLREYNDYLELVEKIVFNLTNNIDIEATKRLVEQYKKENKDFKSKSRFSKDEEFIDQVLECEQQTKQLRLEQIRNEHIESKKFRLSQKEKLIDDLMFSDMPANQIVATHGQQVIQEANEMQLRATEARKAPPQFSTGIKVGKNDSIFLPVPTQVPVETYKYKAPVIDYCGPSVPSSDLIAEKGFTQHVRPASESETAAGYENTIACLRALQDSVCGLYFEV